MHLASQLEKNYGKSQTTKILENFSKGIKKRRICTLILETVEKMQKVYLKSVIFKK
jgi:hypothetical protein